ncbi:MAG: glycosyltransferase [Pseudomonadota bacterium]
MEHDPELLDTDADPVMPERSRILYLVHDLDDAAVWRRVQMLRLGGAEVELAGFRRRSGTLPEPALILGQTRNGQMTHRALAVLRQRLRLGRLTKEVSPPDAILCRNLEMLALAVPLKRAFSNADIPLSYEVLDVHRLMVGDGLVASALRRIERALCREVDHLIVSSPAFVEAHFNAHNQWDGTPLLVENKVVLDAPANFTPMKRRTEERGPLRIGWFGILRCPFSLACLDAVTRAAPGRYKVLLRGRPALDVLPQFHDVVNANPDLHFGGPYAYPDDLAEIYGSVDLAWLVDRYDTGANSDWLLPNRLYEGGLNGVPPIGLKGTQIAKRMAQLGVGLTLEQADLAEVSTRLGALRGDDLTALQKMQEVIPRSTWLVSPEEAHAVTAQLLGVSVEVETRQPAPVTGGVLVVIPTLDEAQHIEGVLEGLVPFIRRQRACGEAACIVVADGGSNDGTQDIVREVAARHEGVEIKLLHNPGRLQGAAVNLASATYGADHDWLMRLDAHARYPETYPDVLLEEAAESGAESVVVAMNAVGERPLQRLIALTQNSRLGNGGAAHRTGLGGRFVDHGHHALMRRSAFEAIGGYDERFSHNEDAELDHRLRNAGHRIWLTRRTTMTYLPRADLKGLARQYLNFGRGRARTTRKHHLRPRIRQVAMIGVAPSVSLALLSPISVIFAVPALVWAAACGVGGLAVARQQGEMRAFASGPIAALMQLSWSVGFWQEVLGAPRLSSAKADRPEIARRRDIRSVAVGVCTYKRASLGETLSTLELQDLPENVSLSIIVVDNDERPSAEAEVAEFARSSRHQVVYRHAPAGNISVARNAALEEAEARNLPIFAFIDDDELAPQDWLSTLLDRLADGDAEVVLGPTLAIYPRDAPGWMRRLRVHDTTPEVGSDGRPIAGHSCNVIMDLGSPALKGRRFDPARGVSGGEDTAFFKDAMEAGARLAYAPDARLREHVPADRARLNWLLKRRFRMGQTHGSLLRRGKTAGATVAQMGLASAKVIYCGTFALLTAPFAASRNANLLRGALHAGTLASLLGLRSVAIYGESGPSGTRAP